MSKSLESTTFDVDWCRRQFPALNRRVGTQSAVFFDGPAGSQVPRRVIHAMVDYLVRMNANHAGVFETSRLSDAMLAEAHRGLADLLGTRDPQTVIFGPNMTSLTLALSRSLARTWKRGDEVLVTRLEHDANVSPWILAAQDAGASVRHVDFHAEDCTLDMEDLAAKLSSRTRLVAVGCASNAVGTVSPMDQIVRRAHGAGALVFFDAVHYAPHRLMEVDRWGCDFLACSAYKFFGPHVGVLWGRRELLQELPAYKVRPAPDDLPGRWMTGTQNHEGIAGTLAAVEYLADLGRTLSAEAPMDSCTDNATGATGSLSASAVSAQVGAAGGLPSRSFRSPGTNDRRAALEAAYRGIAAYEGGLVAELLAGLAEIAGVKVWGMTDPAQLDQRVPTVSITHRRLAARPLAEYLAERGVFVWHGHFYALPVTEALGLEPDGLVRIGLLHYNTREEVGRLLVLLRELG